MRKKWLVGGLIVLSLLVGSAMLLKNLNSSRNSIASISFDSQAGFLGITECLTGSVEYSCLDDFIATYAKETGESVGEILYAMEVSRSADQLVEDSCHPIAHAIGRYSLSKHQNIGDAFQACDFTCYSGCYHGVMERMFFSDAELSKGSQHLTLADLETKIPGICDRDKFKSPTNVLIFQCLHGLGHAAMFSLDYNLRDALAACDLLETQYQRESCYGGVFMENITAFDSSKRDLNDDPHYPCNVVEEKYRNGCYLLQTSRMSELRYQPLQMAELCRDAGKERYTCYMSLGRDLSYLAKSDRLNEAAAICQGDIGDPKYTQHCTAGVVYLLVDDAAGLDLAFGFCNLLDEPESSRCYHSLADYRANIYELEPDRLKQDCYDFAHEGIDKCLEGVRVYESSLAF